MKALKGLLIYIGIVLAIMFGICILLFSLMYFIPSFRLFGVGVVHASEVRNNETIVLAEYSSFDNIELSVNSKKVNISVVPTTESENISYSLSLSTFGIAFDITEYRIIRSVDVEGKTLKVNLSVTEPNGWISNTGSYMKVYVPASYQYNLLSKIESGNIYLGDKDAILQLNNLTVNSGSGDVYVTNLAKDGVLNLQSLNLTTNSGGVDFSEIGVLNVENKVLINAKNGEYYFNVLNADMDIRGTGVRITANTINCLTSGFTFMSENGYFKVDNLNTMGGAETTIVTENCNVVINKLTGNAGIITTYGNIEIAKAYNDLILESTHGKIVVAEVLGDVRATSQYGDITCNYYKNGTFVNRNGEMFLMSKGEYQAGVVTKIETEDGNFSLDNNINQVYVKIKGDAHGDVTFWNIKKGLDIDTTYQHTIYTGNDGSCEVWLPPRPGEGVYFRFTAKGNISGEISGLTPKYEGDTVQSSDDPQYYPKEEFKDMWYTCCSFWFEGTIEFESIDPMKVSPF